MNDMIFQNQHLIIYLDPLSARVFGVMIMTFPHIQPATPSDYSVFEAKRRRGQMLGPRLIFGLMVNFCCTILNKIHRWLGNWIKHSGNCSERCLLQMQELK